MVDIIIPTYNNADTMERTLLSVISQLYTDWHLIIVNDASTDETLEIVDRYAKAMPDRVTVITNEVNSGAGVSRKVGLDAATSEFITFLDADDILKPDFLKMSMELQAQHDSDIVYTSFTILYPQGITKIEPAGDFIMEGEATTTLHFNTPLKFLTGKIIRTSLAKSVRFSPKRVGEDVQTLFYLTYEAKKVRSSSYSGYVHCFREGSLLADAPYFFCYCGSTSAEQEIIDYLIGKGDEKLWKYLLTASVMNFNKIKEAIKQGKQVKRGDVLKNSAAWKEIQKWYKDHTKYIKQIETKTK